MHVSNKPYEQKVVSVQARDKAKHSDNYEEPDSRTDWEAREVVHANTKFFMCQFVGDRDNAFGFVFYKGDENDIEDEEHGAAEDVEDEAGSVEDFEVPSSDDHYEWDNSPKHVHTNTMTFQPICSV